MVEINNNLKMEVKLVSNEILKPSSPTPPENKKFTLSFFDQAFPPIHCQMVLFYPNSQSQPQPQPQPEPQEKKPIDIEGLKESLCETLTTFYPFAGRCENESTILCEDQGVPFSVTNVNCNVSDVLNSSNKMELYPKLMPPQDEDYDVNKSRNIGDLVLISFQVNVFLCGGIAVGCEALHKITDMAALANFFIYWAAVATKKSGAEVQAFAPDFEASVKAFPPSPNVPRMVSVYALRDMLGLRRSVRVAGRNFVFSEAAITELRGLTASERLPAPTRFEAVGAFVWANALAAACTAGEEVETTGVSIFADLRSRTSPPLPKGTFGNLVRAATARAQNGVELGAFATEMHAALTELKKIYKDSDGESMTEEMLRDWEEGNRDMMYKPGFFKISSWCKLGLHEANFGFGKPWIVPTNGVTFPNQRNFIYFTDDLSGTGIEVWLFIEEKEMQILESDPQFLAFAAPN